MVNQVTSESSPLARAGNTITYNSVPQTADEVSPAPAGHEGKEHYNLVGLSPSSFWVLCLSMWMCGFLVAFDGTVVATLLGPISSSFNATNSASWLGTSYMLSVCCFTSVYGRLCGIYGRRNTLLIALTFFTVGNLLCAIAPSMNLLIAARALAGVGGGGLSAVTSVVMSDIVPITHRGIFQGYGNIMFGLGSGVGAPLGGIINDSLNWRWVFYLQIPICILAIVMIYLKVVYPYALPPPPSGITKPTSWQNLKRIDFLGCFLLAGWLGSALIAISLKTNSTASKAVAWSEPKIIGLFVASGVLLVVFLLVELRYAAEPVMPFELLNRRTCVAVAVNNFTLSLVLFATLYSVPLFLTAVRQMSATQAGQHLIPNSVIGAISSLSCGYYVRYTGRYKWLCFWTALTGLLSSILIATWGVNTPGHMLWWNFAPMNLSGAAVTTLTVVALIADVKRDHVAVATSLSYLSRTVGQVLGISFSGALTQAVLQKELESRITGPDAERLISSIRQSSASIKSLPPALKEAAIVSYEKALHAVFLVAIVGSVVMVLSILGIREVDMSDKLGKKVPDEEVESDSD